MLETASKTTTKQHFSLGSVSWSLNTLFNPTPLSKTMTSLQYLNDQPFRLKYDPAIHQERRPASRKSSILQTSTSISIILSMLNSTGMFPYLLIIAFLFNVYRNRFYLAAERVKKFAFGRKAYHSQSLSGVASSEHLNKLSRVSSTDTIRKLSKSIRKSFDNFTQRVALQAITRKECFARLNYIECISISDLLIIFRYATDVNQVDFDKKKFMEEQSQQVRAMVTAMVSGKRSIRRLNTMFSL